MLLWADLAARENDTVLVMLIQQQPLQRLHV
jgi:hypothetical protein